VGTTKIGLVQTITRVVAVVDLAVVDLAVVVLAVVDLAVVDLAVVDLAVVDLVDLVDRGPVAALAWLFTAFIPWW
jgi:hypothetical protein